MKIIPAKFIADDGREFDTEAGCTEYEADFPFLTLLHEVEEGVKENPKFAADIERLGTQIARDRRERGELRRERKRKGDNSAAETPPDPPGTAPMPYYRGPEDVSDMGASEANEGEA